jgi:hypothetical protein
MTSTAYTVARREDALDFMADYPGYGEQRWYTSALAAEQVSFSWRRMLHNDTDDEAQLLIFSPRLQEPPTELRDDFWA